MFSVGLKVEDSQDAEIKASTCRKGYRRKRTAFTLEQLTRLEEAFTVNKYPGIELRDNLAHELNVSEGRIQVNRELVFAHSPKSIQLWNYIF